MTSIHHSAKSLWSTTRPPVEPAYTSIHHLDPLLPIYPSRPSLDPKSTAYSGARSFAGSESRSFETGDAKSSYPRGPNTWKRTKKWGFSLRNWSWELATWVLGSAAFAVIVALLITYKDERFDKWHSEIQITTMIAALSQLAQSALLVSLAACLGQLKWTWLRDERSASDLQLFDEASRGPWGSLRLLALGVFPSRTIRRNAFGFPKLAVLGALAVILMLAFSTFAQQAVAIVLREYVVEDARPGLNRTLRYEQRDGTTLLAQGLSAGGDVFMSDAITVGLFSRTNTPSDVVGDCGTERCDWEPYWTLALCPSVEDVTSRIISVDPDGVVEGVPMTATNLTSAAYSISLSLDSDATLRQGINDTLASNMTIEKRPLLSDSLVMIYDPCTPDWYASRNDTQNWTAYRVQLHLCLQHQNSSFHNASMQTEVLENKLDVAWQIRAINGSTSPDICGESPDGTHCINDNYLQSFADRLEITLQGNASTAPGGDNYYRPERFRTFVTDIFGPNPTACTDISTTSRSNLVNRMLNIASSMTNTMRLAPSAEQVSGTARTTAQFIQVNAAWLAYPGSLWVMSTIFLIGTIYHSRLSAVPLWKSSSLALLMSRDSNNALRSEQEVTEAFRHTGMQLKDSDYGWQLVQHTEAPVR